MSDEHGGGDNRRTQIAHLKFHIDDDSFSAYISEQSKSGYC